MKMNIQSALNEMVILVVLHATFPSVQKAPFFNRCIAFYDAIISLYITFTFKSILNLLYSIYKLIPHCRHFVIHYNLLKIQPGNSPFNFRRQAIPFEIQQKIRSIKGRAP